MFFNDSAKITWKGKEYTCPVNMKLVKLMESNGFNAAVTNARMSAGGVPPISLLAEMVQWLLFSGGCHDITEDDVYCELMNNSMDDSNIELIKSAKALSELFIPKIEPSDRVGKSEKKK
jgi:hypothetical protein